MPNTLKTLISSLNLAPSSWFVLGTLISTFASISGFAADHDSDHKNNHHMGMPETPPLYETESKVNQGGSFVGAQAQFGQAQSTSAGSAGQAYTLGLGWGYVSSWGRWARMESGAEVFTGELNFRHDKNSQTISIPIKLGALAKLGYGYSLGHDLFGVWSLGVGAVLAEYEGKSVDLNQTLSSESDLWGTIIRASAALVTPFGSSLEGFGAITWNHFILDTGTLKDSAGNKTSGQALNVNMPGVLFGVRMPL